MDLEEIQAVWSDLSKRLDQQKQLTDQLILDMTKQKYRRRFDKITLYETMGSVVCFVAALLLFMNFHKLDTWYLQLMGVMALMFLVLLPLLVLHALYRIKNLDIAQINYKETLLGYERARNWLLWLQRTAIYASILFALISFPLAGKIMKDKDFLVDTYSWLWFVPFLLLFLGFFARWGYKNYQRITKGAESLIRELE